MNHVTASGRRAWWRVAVVGASFAALACDAMAGRATVTRVDITSESSAPGREEPYRAAKVVLQRSEGGYRRTCSLQTGKKKTAMAPDLVPALVVEHLADLLEQPAQTDVSLDQLGVDVPREVLAPKLAKTLGHEPDGRELAYIDTMFRTPAVLTRAIRVYLLQLHQDLAPRVQVKVTFSDGRSLVTSSRSHEPLMLPWAVPLGATWTTDIPASVRALVPAQDPNIDLLDVQGFRKVGADVLAQVLSGALGTHETELTMPGVTKALRARFDLIDASPNSRPGDPASDTEPVVATVRLAEGPANLWAKLTLRVKDGKAADERQLDAIAELAALASGKDIGEGAIALQFYANRMWLILPDHLTVSFPNERDSSGPIPASEVHVFTAGGQPVVRTVRTPAHK